MQPELRGKSENNRESALLKRVADGDREALSHLYEVYHGRLFKFVFRLTNSYTIADEMVNDIMLLVWQKAASFRGESKVSTWVFGIAYRLTMRRVSRKKLHIAFHQDVDELMATNTPSIEIEDWVKTGIHELPAAQQMTVILVFYLGLSYEETAEVCECPVNTVKTRMFHARRKLKELLEQLAIPGNLQSEKIHD